MLQILPRVIWGVLIMLPLTLSSNLALSEEKEVNEFKVATWCKAPRNKRVIPNILGLSVEEAKKRIKACDLVWSYSDSPKTQSYLPIGSIGDQEPDGGALVNKGDVVRGFKSLGFYLPDFIGWSQTDAEKWIKELRLGVVTNTIRNSQPSGTVINQTPSNAQLFNSGLPAQLLVSEGPWVDIPSDIVGKQWAPAKAELEGKNLIVEHAGGDLTSGRRPINICETEVWYPVVASTNPAPSRRLFEGDTVRVKTKRRTEIIFYIPPNVQCP